MPSHSFCQLGHLNGTFPVSMRSRPELQDHRWARRRGLASLHACHKLTLSLPGLKRHSSNASLTPRGKRTVPAHQATFRSSASQRSPQVAEPTFPAREVAGTASATTGDMAWEGTLNAGWKLPNFNIKIALQPNRNSRRLKPTRRLYCM